MRPGKFGEAPPVQGDLEYAGVYYGRPRFSLLTCLEWLCCNIVPTALVNTGNGGSLTTGQAVANWLPTGVGAGQQAKVNKGREPTYTLTQWSLTASINRLTESMNTFGKNG